MTEAATDFGLKAWTDFWGQASRVAMQAQETAGRAFADAVKTMPGMTGFPIPGAPAGGSAGAAPDIGELNKAGRALSELWTTASRVANTLAQALAAGAKGLEPGAEATFRAMADPRTWLASAGGIDGMAAGVAEAPQLADLWAAERRQARVLQAWIELRRREMEHQSVVLKAWLGAGQEFADTLGARTKTEGRAPAGRALLALWTDTANRVLLETQRTEPFLGTQAAMIRAGSELRLAQRELAERWAEQFDLPTRTELDEVHKTVTELRRELRSLKSRRRGSDSAPK